MSYKSLNTMAVMASSMMVVSAIYPLETPLIPDDTILPSPIIWVKTSTSRLLSLCSPPFEEKIRSSSRWNNELA